VLTSTLRRASGPGIVGPMISLREAAQRLDIPLEMAKRHGLPARMEEAEVERMRANPPQWLAQSLANRKAGARPVWVELRCDVCGRTESVRPKKWWPEFTYVTCEEHSRDELPSPGALYRQEVDGIGSRFVGIADVTA